MNEEEMLEKFKKGLRKRLSSYGDVGRSAKAAGVDPATVSRWGSPGYKGLPTVWQTLRIAKERVLSPAWLAFELGPENLAAATRGFDLGRELEQNPSLAKLYFALSRMDEERRDGLINVLDIRPDRAPSNKRDHADTIIQQVADLLTQQGNKPVPLTVDDAKAYRHLMQLLTRLLDDQPSAPNDDTHGAAPNAEAETIHDATQTPSPEK